MVAPLVASVIVTLMLDVVNVLNQARTQVQPFAEITGNHRA